MADEADQRLREIQGQYLDFLDDEVLINFSIIYVQQSTRNKFLRSQNC